jgi:hypothetical protein
MRARVTLVHNWLTQMCGGEAHDNHSDGKNQARSPVHGMPKHRLPPIVIRAVWLTLDYPW